MRKSRHPIWRYSPAIVLLAAVVADARQSGDSDLWWHLLSGRELLAHGSWPHDNPYTYSAVGYPWLHHEWLSEVLMAWMYNHFGAAGLKALKLVCSLGIFGMLTIADAEAGASEAFHTIVLLLVALILMPTMQFRPQMFDFLFLSAIVALLARDNRIGTASMWLTIPIILLWSNMHGGFIVGIAAVGAYGGAMVLRDLVARSDSRHGILILVIAAAAALATLVTFLIPPARDTWRSVIFSISNPMTAQTIADWKPLLPAAEGAFQAGGESLRYFALVIGFFAAGVISSVATRRVSDAPLIAVAATMLAAAVMSVRNIPFAAIAIAPVLASNLSLLLPLSGNAPPQISRAPAHAPMRLALTIVVVAVTVAYASVSGALSRTIDISEFPAGAMEFMKAHGLKGNVLADFSWGSYVRWQGGSDWKVFIDSRYDLAYPPQVTLDYIAIHGGLPRGASVLAAYPHDYVLVETHSPAARLVESQRDWTTIYSDPLATLYARRGSAASKIAGVPVAAPRRVWGFP